MNEHFQVGVGRKDITPELGGQLLGYRPRNSTSVHDALKVTAIALCQGDVKAMVISADVCLIKTELADKIKTLITFETGITHITISATHTHSGANTCGMIGWGDIDTEYCENIFIPRILEAAIDAVSSLKAVLLGVGIVKSMVGINRRQHNANGTIDLGQNPWGIFDDNMTVLRFDEPCGKTVVNLVHYGAHCTASGAGPEISRDWSGIMIDRLEAETGGISVFINGSEGDVGPRLSNGKTTGDISLASELGGVAAMDAIRAWRNAKNTKSVNLSVITGELALPVKPRVSYDEAIKETLKNPRVWLAELRQYYENILEAYDNNIPEETHLVLPQTIIAIGDVVLVPFPFEVFSEISLRMRAYSMFEYTLCMGITNGSREYLPSQDQLCRGGYEVEMFRTEGVQLLLDNTDDTIINENLRLMRKLKYTE